MTLFFSQPNSNLNPFEINQDDFINILLNYSDFKYVHKDNLRLLGSRLTATDDYVVYKVLSTCNDDGHLSDKQFNLKYENIVKLQNLMADEESICPYINNTFFITFRNRRLFIIEENYEKDFIPISKYIDNQVDNICDIHNIVDYISDIVSILVSYNIDHKDINTSNFLINPLNKEIILIDWEFAKKISDLHNSFEDINEELVLTIQDLYLMFNNKIEKGKLKSFLEYYYQNENKRNILQPTNNHDIINSIGHIIEESVELRQCFPRKYWKTKETIAAYNDQLAELADIFIMWCITAYTMGFSEKAVIDAIHEKQNYNKNRGDHAQV